MTFTSNGVRVTVVGVMARLRAGQSGARFPAGTRKFSRLEDVQTSEWIKLRCVLIGT